LIENPADILPISTTAKPADGLDKCRILDPRTTRGGRELKAALVKTVR